MRATNRAGHASEVSSNVISLDGEPPELLNMGVEGLLDDTTALDQCLLSGDGAVRVTWRKGAAVDTTLSHFTVQAFDATTYLPATAEVVVDGHTGEGLCPGVCTQNVFNGQPEPCYADPACLDENNAGYNGGLGCNAGGKGQLYRFCGFANQAGEVYPACPTTDAAFVDVFAAEGTRLRFVVGAVDSAGAASRALARLRRRRSPLAAGYVVVPSGFTLGADSYAHDVAAPLKMCFNGFIDMHAGVKTIEYEVLIRNMTAGRRLSEDGDCEGVAISRRVVDVALAGHCVNASLTLLHGHEVHGALSPSTRRGTARAGRDVGGRRRHAARGAWPRRARLRPERRAPAVGVLRTPLVRLLRPSDVHLLPRDLRSLPRGRDGCLRTASLV